MMHLYHLRGNFMLDWMHKHQESIRVWNDRETHIASGVPLSNLDECNPQYLAWYRDITRVLIGNPRHRRQHVDGYHATGSGVVILVNTVQECIRKIEETIDIAGSEAKRNLIKIRDTCRRGLDAVGSSMRCSGASSLLDERAYHLPTLGCQSRYQNINQRGRGIRRGGRKKRLPRAMNVEPEANEMLAIIPFTSGAGTSGEGTSTRDGTESQPQVVVPSVRRPRRVRKTVSRYTPC